MKEMKNTELCQSTVFDCSREFLFIGGAPRSGTTLLAQLFDSHPDMFIFGSEHKTVENYFKNLDDIERYARDDFINLRSAGQQTLLANSKFLEAKNKQLLEEYGKRFESELDSELFKSTYLNCITNTPVTLSAMLDSLAFAQMRSLGRTGQPKQAKEKVLAFKQPFFTEVFASQTAAEIENCRFLHILRDPKSRYASAKTRRLSASKRKGIGLDHINRLPYPEGHALIDATSRHLARKNLETLGPDKYRIVDFEQLVASPQNVVEDLLQWLNLPIDQFQAIPMRFGRPVESGSTLSKGFSVDRTATDRQDLYRSITSSRERSVYEIALKKHLGESDGSRIRIFFSLLLPLPDSTWKNYLCQLLSGMRWLISGKPFPVEKFVEMAKLGKVSVDGGT